MHDLQRYVALMFLFRNIFTYSEIWVQNTIKMVVIIATTWKW